MKRFLIGLLMVSLLMPYLPEKGKVEREVGRYQLETITYVSKKGTTYIVETVLDTKTGKVVIRRKKKASLYKLPYKDRRGQIITEE